MSSRRPARGGLAALAAFCMAGCTTQPPQTTVVSTPSNRCGAGPTFAAGGERATLWIRSSAEFRTVSESIYRAALASLAQGLADSAWTAEPAQTGSFSALPPAVVMDIDETVLDNSAPQAEMLRDGTCFAEFETVWDAWVAKRSAPAVPGAAEFVRAARALKDPQGRPVRVFFITNRECSRRDGIEAVCPQQDDSAANLRSLGLDSPTLADDLMLKGEVPEWVSEKLPRRLEVARNFRIVLNIGDDLADFLPDVRRQSPQDREHARCTANVQWGRQWFVIPNPMYGSWLVALGPDAGAALAAEPPAPANCARN